MPTFLRHLISTKGPIHAVERSLEILVRFTRGGRRLDRITGLIESTLGPRGSRMTFFVTAGTIRRHRHRIERLRRLGHDIGSHGLYHSRFDLLPPEHQAYILGESHRILTNAGFEVHGFRSPYLNYNESTRNALDLGPFIWTSGEVIFWNKGLRQIAGMDRLEALYSYHLWDLMLSLPDLSRRVMDIPVSAPDDEILYERYRVRDANGLYGQWIRVFEEIHSAGEMFHLMFHTERFSRVHKAIGDVLDYVRRARPPVWHATLNELADWWKRRSEWSWHRLDNGQVTIDAPAEATVLVKGRASESESPESNRFYKDYHPQPRAETYPAFTIGVSPTCPPSLREFLHGEGFLAEQAASAQGHSLFLSCPDFKLNEARKLLDEVDACTKPILRLWRWPNGCRSAFCISADICAIDLRDFIERTQHFRTPYHYRKAKSEKRIANSEQPIAKKTVWIDLDNTPHVPFFVPIIRELEKRGCRVVISARDAFQVCELASQCRLPYAKIGHHYGKNLFLKVYGWAWRAAQLAPFALREKPDLALSHGARSQLLVANILRIPTVLLSDYEHSSSPPFCRPKYELVPSVIPTNGLVGARVLKYSGIKEDVYVPSFVPDPAILSELGLSEHDLVITVRPPATEAHYHNPESELLLSELINWALTKSDAKIVLLPRNERQGFQLKEHNSAWFANGRVIVPKHVLNGLNLVWYSDLVVSGGGTMNREAASLGVPVYSIFRGPIGAVDRYLQAEGRLDLISSVEEIRNKVQFRRRSKGSMPDSRSRQALQQIMDHLETILFPEGRCLGQR